MKKIAAELMRRYLRPQYAPVTIPIALSLLGTLFFSYGDKNFIAHLFEHRLSPGYILIAPFFHSNAVHFLFDVITLHYIGGQLLLPTIGTRRFVILFAVGIVTSQLGNAFFSPVPCIGISAAIITLLACSLRPYGKLPMKFLIIHDILRLKPFPLRNIAIIIVIIDICGIIFNWQFLAHRAHLTGFATGLIAGHILFPRRKP